MPSLPNESRREAFNYTSREPPPSYWAPYKNSSNHLEPRRAPRRPAPSLPTRGQIQQIAIRSRVEQYRNRISVSDTDSEEERIRRSRILSPPRNSNGFKNEVLLGEFRTDNEVDVPFSFPFSSFNFLPKVFSALLRF